MAILKCKMCGGDLEVINGATVAECEYCGTRQTVPNADDDKKLTLFARANRLRMGNEFDKAAGVYENIVADFPEEAEAYWGLVLCKYGIEYVDDPATAKKIPTCHRSSFESVFDDNNFEQTLENADPIARSVYRDEAKHIEEIRKGILEVSAKEEPYDIFICYKETGHDGNRTVDSVMAQNVYDMLTDKGYRVFFSRITLEDKLGRQYEPYIFAALNSAKIMLVFGTDYEYFNAVWVKNEWSRFLKLMATDKSKHLIPCYKNLDAYDMPKEFLNIQSQDMSKLGWEQDLVRGIQKLHPLNATPAPVSAPAANTATTDTLLKRAFMFLEDGEFEKANQYIEKVLDIDPENASAYLCKLMADFRVRQEAELGEVSSRLDLNSTYNKIMQYGDASLRARIEGYNQKVTARIGKRNAQLQELETKKRAVMDAVAKSELALMTAQGKCDGITQRIKERSSYLNELQTTIAKLKKDFASCENERKYRYVPIWVLIPLFIISVVAFAVSLYSTDMIGEIPVILLLGFGTLISAGLVILSFFREKVGIVGIIIVVVTFLLFLFIGLWVEHGGPFKAIGKVASLMFFFISGNKLKYVFTFTVLTISLFFSNFINYGVGVIFAIVCRIRKRSARRRYKTLSAELQKKTAEYDEKVKSDAELAGLNEAQNNAKAEYNLAFNECVQKIRAANAEYLRTASAYGLKAEALVPAKYR